MRNAREEARQRVGGALDVRVLEPSPPAVNEAPWFADDPVAGGEILPIERPGTRTWEQLFADTGDQDVLMWCWSHQLTASAGLITELPPTFAATRAGLHALAEHVLAPARYQANGKIGLRYTFQGFGTPFFGDDRQLRVQRGVLLVDETPHPLTTLRAAADAAGVELGQGTGVYDPTTPLDADAPLNIETTAAWALGDWFGFACRLLEQLREDAAETDKPARVQLWPEHFDLAVDLGPDGRRANYGASPGDADHPEPYLYVGPWGERSDDPFWNEPFGASLSYTDIIGGADGLSFFREGRSRV